MTAKTSSTPRKKKKNAAASASSSNGSVNEEIRTSIYKTQHPVAHLRMLNDEEGAHAEYTRLTVCDAAIESPMLEAVLADNNTRQLLMDQLLEASSSILDAYGGSSTVVLPPSLVPLASEEPGDDGGGVKSKTRRRGRKAFRFDYATIMYASMDEDVATRLCERWNTRSRTVKSRAAIAIALSEFYGLEVGINERLISGPMRFWEVELRDGVINISKNNKVHHRIPLTAK
jgi:hypothetical protein